MTKHRLFLFVILVLTILMFGFSIVVTAQPINVGILFAHRVITNQQKLLADDGEQLDRFGASVALDGDTLLVGAYQEDFKGSNAGSAYIYTRNVDGIWSQQAKLVAEDGAQDDFFGKSVAISGDTAVIGAPGDDGTFTGTGSAYVFVRDGFTWSFQQKLTASDAGEVDTFGNSVAVDGDTVLVGAYLDGSFDDGSAYVFVRSGTTWTEQQKLTAQDAANFDKFGHSVVLDGDTALIGAIGDNSAAGSAYVFIRNGTTWSEQAKLNGSDSANNDEFGYSVSLDGDTALVGAWQNQENGFGAGAAYVFTRTADVWMQQQKLVPADNQVGDFFGISVAVSDDMALIGAIGEEVDSSDLDSGSAYVYVRDEGIWIEQPKVTASDRTALDSFGISVALQNDTLIVGADLDDDRGESSGSVYAYIEDGTVIPTPTPTLEATSTPEAQQLLVNGGFDTVGSDGKPVLSPWTVANGTGDKVKCNKDKTGDGDTNDPEDKIFAYEGTCAFVFKGGAGEASKLRQAGTIPQSGDTLTLTLYAKTGSAPNAKAKLKVTYTDGTQTSKRKFELTANSDYTLFTDTLSLASSAVNTIRLSIDNKAASGKLSIDSVSLTASDGTTLLPLP